jgi:hypothetical protein
MAPRKKTPDIITITARASDFDDLTVAELGALEEYLGRPLLTPSEDGNTFHRGNLYSADIFGFITIIQRRKDPEWTLPPDTKLSSIKWVGAPVGSTAPRPSRKDRRVRK